MKKLISIGVAVALLVTFMVPVAVAADDPPPTYAKIPFTIVGEGIALIGDLVSMADAKLGLGLGFDVAQFTVPLSEYIQGPLSYTMDMMAWGVYIVAGLADPVLTEFAPDMMWISDVLNDLVCYFFTPFNSLVDLCFP